MARDDVNIKVSSNVAEAIRLWQAMEEGPKGMAREIEAFGSKGKRASKDLGTHLDSVIGKWTSIEVGIGLAQKALSKFVDFQKQLRRETEEATDSVDELFTRFRIQAGTGLASGQEGRYLQGITNVGLARKVSPQTAFGGATQLVSSGVSPADVVEGGVLDEFLQLLTATNQAGQDADSTSLAKALIRYMRSTGVPRTAAGVRSTSVALRGLFQGTDIQLENLERFSGEASTIGSFTGEGANEMLAVFTQFIDALGERRGSTAFRAGVVNMATAGATPVKVAALASLGLKPEDVDFQGESFMTAMTRLQAAMAKVPPGQRNIAASQLFGQEGLGFFNELLVNPQGLAESRRRIGLTKDTGAFGELVAYGESSRGAFARQSEFAERAALYDPSITSTEAVGARFRAALEEEGIDPIRKFLARGAFQAGSYFFDPEDLIGRVGVTPGVARKALGQEPLEIRVRVLGQDGREIPSETEVNRINQPAQ